MTQALGITAMGMGGVFAFLILLIAAMHILSYWINKHNQLDKIAVAIACARRGK